MSVEKIVSFVLGEIPGFGKLRLGMTPAEAMMADRRKSQRNDREDGRFAHLDLHRIPQRLHDVRFRTGRRFEFILL